MSAWLQCIYMQNISILVKNYLENLRSHMQWYAISDFVEPKFVHSEGKKTKNKKLLKIVQKTNSQCFFFFFLILFTLVCIFVISTSLTKWGSSLSMLSGAKLLAGPSLASCFLRSLACFMAWALRLLMWSPYKGTFVCGGTGTRSMSSWGCPPIWEATRHKRGRSF